MKILAIIPARCGSKGIPFKNIIDVNGKPLIQYSIEIALQLRLNNLIDEIIVSTDCNEIKEISEHSGLKVPFLRPKNISGDKKSFEVDISSTNCVDVFGVRPCTVRALVRAEDMTAYYLLLVQKQVILYMIVKTTSLPYSWL